jgi:hypothetical protein
MRLHASYHYAATDLPVVVQEAQQRALCDTCCHCCRHGLLIHTNGALSAALQPATSTAGKQNIDYVLWRGVVRCDGVK